MKQQERRRLNKARAGSNKRLMRMLVACGGSPADMLELYYWAKEPGLRQLIRAIATMPEETRASLAMFATLGRDAGSVVADFDPHGVLMLYSAEASKIAALAQRAADDDAQGLHRLLN